jgi:Spy/CpxP family protein refolding chaperone
MEVLMKKKRWILLGGLIILAVIGFSMVSHAGRHFANPMAMGPMYRLNLLSEELGLTDDQRAALKNLVRSHRQEIQPLVKTVIAKKRALQELVLAENPDPAAIRQASADLGNAIGEAAVLGSTLAQKAQSILTPEQLNQFREKRQNRQKAFDESLREWQERNPAF